MHPVAMKIKATQRYVTIISFFPYWEAGTLPCENIKIEKPLVDSEPKNKQRGNGAI